MPAAVGPRGVWGPSHGGLLLLFTLPVRWPWCGCSSLCVSFPHLRGAADVAGGQACVPAVHTHLGGDLWLRHCNPSSMVMPWTWRQGEWCLVAVMDPLSLF